MIPLPRRIFRLSLALAAAAWTAGWAAPAEALSPWTDWFVLRENILARVQIAERMGSVIGSRWEFRIDPKRIEQVPDLAGMAIYLTYRQAIAPEGVKGFGTLHDDNTARRVFFPAGQHATSIHREKELLWFPQDSTDVHQTISWKPGDILPTVETPSNGRKGLSWGPVIAGLEVNSERMLRFSQERVRRDAYIPATP
ncbi:hypothetical protein Verru16b_02880 [Lacunisphaera limnophila]|uniref:Uncharacterized protein n=1 Tax=Lacunisphaera limnophila TaxID=1838286 RepID=A0A1D8AY27_9BACT|nr:hypothetical protein [Lacunisphaera limnophila]AOS45792.1 hypothetical protein Verru16b_02880 [Lacunisphaera limnophila]